MCVDYRDLNRVSPKDNFLLPYIDAFIDNTTKYSLFSFMDGFSGYNQIKMDPKDMEKTIVGITDVLETLAAMFKVGMKVDAEPIRISLQELPVHYSNVDEEVDGKPWYYDSLQYAKYRQYPEKAYENDKKIIRR
ncbi:Uncharacterized protein TCM_040590 [Theobroma cacao]|uniref:Reverse transcriptase domain-containing protein n=1 Tax=Theobroma cacao TaxID=3641 RepID=A0A061GT46_THECC|nr:Uncharacterized protein TCM_040590 [Theobroma cacao]